MLKTVAKRNIFVDIVMHFTGTCDKLKIQKDSFFIKTLIFYNILNIFININIYIYIYNTYRKTKSTENFHIFYH